MSVSLLMTRAATLAVMLAIVGTAVTITTATSAHADKAKSCKSGKVYNPDTGKCVTRRGS